MADKSLNLLDIENLLDARKPSTSESEEEKGWRKHLKVAVIHVALLLASILYAVAGSLIFHSVEMPNERLVKGESIERIRNFRELLVVSMWNNSRRSDMNETEWRTRSTKDISKLTDMLYIAFKKEFVKFRHVTMQIHDAEANETDTDIWARHSAFFFAITTMATIGYGNIVPVTLKGRVICLFFALFGTPLAVLTIGDFGKFLSESIIRVYKGYKKLRGKIKCLAKCSSKKKSATLRSDSLLGDLDDEDDDEIFTYEDILAHHIQVPVVLVFGTLLVYIALGGFLFEFLEGWSYIDAFYFCFISLTSVGFGDLVPKEHKYMWIMLLYIGIGLAVSTMCIDLVGRQYVWKIHYFGRKFKEADLLQLLKRKRMIERRLAIAQLNSNAADIRQIYYDAVSKTDESLPSPEMQIAAMEMFNPIEMVSSDLANVNTLDVISPQWPLDNVYTYEEPEIEEIYLTPPDLSPISTPPSVYERIRMLILGKRDSILSPSGPSIEMQCSLDTCPSIYDREMMMRRQAQSVTSWTPSGPDISVHCSMSTSPSVHEREELYSKFGVKAESPDSFEYNFRLPSPDFEELARAARSETRNASCPPIVLQVVLAEPIRSPTPTSSVSSSSSSDALTPPEEPIRTPSPISNPSSPRRLLPPPKMLSLPAPSALLALTYPDPIGISEIEQWDSFKTMMEESSENNLQVPNICVEQPSIADDDSDDDVYPPSLLSPHDLELDFASCTSSSNQTPVSSPSGDSVMGLEFPFEVDLPLFELPFIPMPDSGRASLSTNSNSEPEMIFHHNLPVYAIEDKAVKAEGALLHAFSCPIKYISMEPPTMVTENYCFVVDGEAVALSEVTRDIEWWKPTGRPTHYYFTEDYRFFRRVHVMVFRGKVISARQRIPKPGGAAGFDQKEVALNKVFKVCRYYSYWRTCSQFHRIVTVMAPVLDSVAKEINFKKRIFVQFLWPNAKETDKSRVASEFTVKPQIPRSPMQPSSSAAKGPRRDTYHFGSKDFLPK